MDPSRLVDLLALKAKVEKETLEAPERKMHVLGGKCYVEVDWRGLMLAAGATRADMVGLTSFLDALDAAGLAVTRSYHRPDYPPCDLCAHKVDGVCNQESGVTLMQRAYEDGRCSHRVPRMIPLQGRKP